MMSVLKEVCKYKKIGRIYDGRIYWDKEGAPCLTKTGSSDKLITYNWMEQGFGFRNTTLMVNENRIDEGRGHVEMSAVRVAF